MARKTVTTCTDDLNGVSGAHSITFGLDGISYEIDLIEANAAKLKSLFGPYVAHARKVQSHPRGVSPSPQTRPRSSGSRHADGFKRSWARANGFTIGDRGRISAEIHQAYTAAQSAPVLAAPPDAVATSPREALTTAAKTIFTNPPAEVIREWALANGFKPKPRGRMSREIYDAFTIARFGR